MSGELVSVLHDGDDTAIARLRSIGDGDAMRGLRQLCATAMTCSTCLTRWKTDGSCDCGDAAGSAGTVP